MDSKKVEIDKVRNYLKSKLRIHLNEIKLKGKVTCKIRKGWISASKIKYEDGTSNVYYNEYTNHVYEEVSNAVKIESRQLFFPACLVCYLHNYSGVCDFSICDKGVVLGRVGLFLISWIKRNVV